MYRMMMIASAVAFLFLGKWLASSTPVLSPLTGLKVASLLPSTNSASISPIDVHSQPLTTEAIAPMADRQAVSTSPANQNTVLFQPDRLTVTDPATKEVIKLPRRSTILGFSRKHVKQPALQAAIDDPKFEFYRVVYDQIRILMYENTAESRQLAEPLARAYNAEAKSMSNAIRQSKVVPEQIDLDNWQPILIPGDG